MEEPNWKEVVLQSLEQRDTRELLSSDIYDAYLKIATLYAALRVEGSTGILPLPTSSTAPTDEITSLKSQIAELYKAQNTHLQTIKSLETGLSSLQHAETQLKQEITDIKSRKRDLELRAALHGETLREKNQQIQILQDELLTTGLSLAVLEERSSKLEEENKSLLDRWLAKVKAEAETMNDANEFLERIREMRMSSPTADDTTVEETQP